MFIYNLLLCKNFIIICHNITPRITNIRRGCILKDLLNCPINISLVARVMPQAGQGIPIKIVDKHTVSNIKFMIVNIMTQRVIAKPYFLNNCIIAFNFKSPILIYTINNIMHKFSLLVNHFVLVVLLIDYT